MQAIPDSKIVMNPVKFESHSSTDIQSHSVR